MKTPFPIALALFLAVLPPAARAFMASDASTNAPYDTGYWNLGDNGGTGFSGWSQIGSAATPNLSIDENKGFSIYANAGVGEGVIGRSFTNGIVLETGTFSVSATHDFTDHFSGFALYTSGETELLRWGVTTTENHETGATATGFWYAPLAGGSPDYVLLASASDDDFIDSRISYSVTWSVVGSSLSVDLSIASDPLSKTFQLTLDTSSSVTAVAALVAGSDPLDTLHFDNLSVEGRAVPEPATLALLLLAGPALFLSRRRC